MSSSSYISLTLLAVVLVQLQTALTEQPLHHTCRGQGKFPPYGSFAASLESVFTTLYKRIETEKPSLGFFSSATNNNESAYGQVLCSGKASPERCQSCLANATLDARTLCPYDRSVVVWYASCSLQYSNINFYGKLDTSNYFTMANSKTLTDAADFMNVTTSFLRELSTTAAANATTRYAFGAKKLFKYLTLYGIAQCTEDLSPRQCTQCFNASFAVLPGGNKQGVRSILEKCLLRYEIYQIVLG